MTELERFLTKADITVQTIYDGDSWDCETAGYPAQGRDDAYDLDVTCTLKDGAADDSVCELCFTVENWSTANYLLVPGAVYGGNRFAARTMPYPPLLEDPSDIGVDVNPIITDVPRLNIDGGPSRIELDTGDGATPAVGFFAAARKRGCLILTEQRTKLGNTRLSVEESDDRKTAWLRTATPAVGTSALGSGEVICLTHRIFIFDCQTVQDLFDRFAVVRKDLSPFATLRNEIPFAACWQIQEEKYNAVNWRCQGEYYGVGTEDTKYQDWQVGWVGGGMSSYPLLFAGTDVSRKRSLKTIDFVFSSQASSGFFHGISHNGTWYGDGFGQPHAARWHLIRKSSDALYFLLKQFLLLAVQEPGWRIPAHWEQGTRRLADAFVRLWDRYGQFGQFVDLDTGDIVVGGSTSAAIAPAGLALAGEFFGHDRYLEVAEEAASFFHGQHVRQGYTTGGPGEILQCPDSESAFALLESFVVLYEVTGNLWWVDKAMDMANQCMTWCVSYDYVWPQGSTFGALGMPTLGTVIANVQNKHSAPGICTLSGDALFKLYRATGDTLYLDLVQEIAHNLPFYLSREDRPIADPSGRPMPPGWINERVNLSAWEGRDRVGEIFFGSCWCEVSSMLTYVELPGIYFHRDTGFVSVFDHVNVQCTDQGTEWVLHVTNPTVFTANVRLLAENSYDMIEPLGQNALYACEQVLVPSRGSQEIRLAKG